MSSKTKSGSKSGADKGGPRRPNPVDAHVGNRVRMRRMLLGMSQEKLGELLGLTFQQVQKYEKGVNRVGASRLYELSRVLSVPVQFFYEDVQDVNDGTDAAPGFGESASESYVVEFLSSREGLELNKSFVKITDPKLRRTVIDLVRSLAAESE